MFDQSSPAISRRTVLWLGAGLTISAPLTGCQAAPAALSNPAVTGWFASLAASLGANILTDFAKDGVDKTIQEWKTGLWELYDTWFPAAKNPCVLSRAQRSETTPNFMMVEIWQSAIDGTSPTCEKNDHIERDPLLDSCGIVINKGADGVLLPPWAWQTLALFCEDTLLEKTGAELNQANALLQVALAPTSSANERETSWANAVAYVSYMTHMGAVDIAKVEQTDHSFKGIIKVSGFPDETGEGTVWEFTLPAYSA